MTDPGLGIFRCIRHALEQLEITPPSETVLRKCIGPPLHESFADILQVPRDRVDAAVAAYRQMYAPTGMWENVIYPGIDDLLSTLENDGFILWVATSKPETFARPILERFRLSSYFRRIYGSELDGTRTNKGDLIEHLLRLECISPLDAVMVGDRKHDIVGAKHNKLRSIGVTWGYGSPEELRDAGADSIVETPLQLLELINLKGQ